VNELVRIEVPGRWEDQAEETVFIGRALQAWFYRELATRDDGLATALHDMSGEKPFSIALRRQPDVRLVITAYGLLAPFVQELSRAMPDRLLLNARWWRREGEALVERCTWPDLAAGLLAPAPESRATMTFVTPTTFRSRGNYLPLPVPQLVFGGLLERWQTWAPVDLGVEAGTALDGIVVRRHRLASVAVQLKGLVPGFVGAAEFEARQSEGPYAGLVGVLARFARFAGVGAKVSTGFGCVDVATAAGRRRAATERASGTGTG